MIRRTAPLLAALVLTSATASAQQPPQMTDPIVHAGLFSLQEDGTPGGYAVQTVETPGGAEAGTVYLSPCESIGASDASRPVSAAATDVWKLTTQATSMTAEQAIVQVSWQRVRRDGQAEAGPTQSNSFTLARGQRMRLETISKPANGACQARHAALDVVFASRTEMRPMPRQTTAQASGGVARTPQSPGAAAAGGGGVVRSGTGGRPVIYRSAHGDMRTVRPGQAVPTTLEAELWLVSSAPGQADQTLRMTSPVRSIPADFQFPSMTIATSRGSFTTRVSGTLEEGRAPDGARRLYFSATRATTFSPAGRPPRDMAPVVEGSTKTTIALPEPGDVVAFEMPPLRIPEGSDAPGSLSIRLRIVEVPMQVFARP